MTLPVLDLPKFDLPFDISLLLHSPIVHFAIVLPIVILLLEVYNLFVKRKSIGFFLFMLIILTVVTFIGAYITGGIDGKEAYALLTVEGKEELTEHKLLGTYLLLFSGVILILKLFAMIGKTFLRVFYFIGLIGFIVLIFKQGIDGGELVYEYGANNERIKILNEELSDTKEELEEAENTISNMKAKPKVETIKVEAKPKVIVEKVLEEKLPVEKELPKQDEKVLKVLEKAAEDVTTKIKNPKPISHPQIESNNTIQ